MSDLVAIVFLGLLGLWLISKMPDGEIPYIKTPPKDKDHDDE